MYHYDRFRNEQKSFKKYYMSTWSYDQFGPSSISMGSVSSCGGMLLALLSSVLISEADMKRRKQITMLAQAIEILNTFQKITPKVLMSSKKAILSPIKIIS